MQLFHDNFRFAIKVSSLMNAKKNEKSRGGLIKCIQANIKNLELYGLNSFDFFPNF